MTPTMELWVELSSPYTYLTVHRVEALAQAAAVSLIWRPFLLGPIFRDRGYSTSPFVLDAARGAYMWRDMERGAAALGLPFRRPSVFPCNSVLATRVALLGMEEGWGPPFVRAAMQAYFAEDRDLGLEEAVRSVLRSLDLPADSVLARATSEEHRHRLRASTDEARRRGVFGAPSFLVGEELFWGNDRLEEAVAFARGRGGGADGS